jgi:sterol desaturase/sphingolipid hydroxylase (fatty acid hydroxylase superfamily)
MPHAWFEPVLFATVVVFVACLIGNKIEFNNRFVNAVVVAILFAVIFGVLVYSGYDKLAMPVATTPAVTTPAN